MGTYGRHRSPGLGQAIALTACLGACDGTRTAPSEEMDLVAAAPLPGEAWPGPRWGRVQRPEDLGWSTEKLQEARLYSEKIRSAAVVVVQDGLVVDQWGEVARPFNVRSIRKSLLNALVGQAVAAGRLSLVSSLTELGIDDEPPLTDAEKKASLGDLLTSRSGVYHAAAYETRANAGRRPPRGSHAPGTFFYYNNWDFNALGTIFERHAGERVFEAFARRIATPLGMQDFSAAACESRLESGSRHAAYIFRISARDLARVGLLYLRRGEWSGREVLRADWVTESTRTHAESAGGGNGYGYLWWVRPPSEAEGRDAFMAEGNGGQFAWVSPSRRLVVVHLTDTDGLWWKRILGRVVDDDQAFGLLHLILAAAPESAKTG